MRLARRLALLALLLIVPESAAAQEEEARMLFEQGNQHLARGLRARGRTRERELSQAVDAYLDVLRLGARTRNVIFNVGLAMEGLGRTTEAFNYFSEYVRAFDLSAEDRAEGTRRLEALRPQVSVLVVESTPEGAQVRIDRSDLPVRGTTPLEIAVTAGTRQVFLARDGYESATTEGVAFVGRSARVWVELAPVPVPVQIIAPSTGRLTLDGQPIAPGRPIPVAPGAHVVRLELPGSSVPVERRFEVEVGSDPLRITLGASMSAVGGGGTPGSQIAMRIDARAEVFVDGLRVGQGDRIDIPVSPGAHQLRVVAPGRNALVHRVRLAREQRLGLNVHLGAVADATGLDWARAVLGFTTLAGLGVTIGLGVRAIELHDYYLQQLEIQIAAHNMHDLVVQYGHNAEDAVIATDIALAITSALAIATIVTLFVDAGGGEQSSVRVRAGASPTALVAELVWRGM